MSLASLPVEESDDSYPFDDNDKLAVLIEETSIKPGLIDPSIPVLVHSIPVSVWYREDLKLYCAKCPAIEVKSHGRIAELCVNSLRKDILFIYKEYVMKSDSVLYADMKRKKYNLLPYFEEL
jgi:hypothetical protein